MENHWVHTSNIVLISYDKRSCARRIRLWNLGYRQMALRKLEMAQVDTVQCIIVGVTKGSRNGSKSGCMIAGNEVLPHGN